jgi:hypothetical protein
MRLLKIIALLVGFAFGWACYSDALTIRSIRSLSAAGAVTNGASFNGATSAQMPPQGGGIQWNILITGSAPTLSFQIQAQMTDGTWVPIIPPYNTAGPATIVLSGSLPTTGQLYSLFGPFLDVRVSITAWTSGTLTADISTAY